MYKIYKVAIVFIFLESIGFLVLCSHVGVSFAHIRCQTFFDILSTCIFSVKGAVMKVLVSFDELLWRQIVSGKIHRDLLFLSQFWTSNHISGKLTHVHVCGLWARSLDWTILYIDHNGKLSRGAGHRLDGLVFQDFQVCFEDFDGIHSFFKIWFGNSKIRAYIFFEVPSGCGILMIPAEFPTEIHAKICPSSSSRNLFRTILIL